MFTVTKRSCNTTYSVSDGRVVHQFSVKVEGLAQLDQEEQQ